MKLCKDCVHIHRDPGFMHKPRCLLYSATKVCTVTGNTLFTANRYCEEINTTGACPGHTTVPPEPLHSPYINVSSLTGCPDARGLAAPVGPAPRQWPMWVRYLAAWCRALWRACKA